MTKKSDKTAPVEKSEKKRTKKDPNDALVARLKSECQSYVDAMQENLRDGLRQEFIELADRGIRRADRRRRWSNFFHDLVIIALIGTMVYLCYHYDINPFQTERPAAPAPEESPSGEQTTQTGGPVKDATWYLANYRYLYDNLATSPDGDQLSSYYLYSADRSASDLPPSLRLAMAYNRLSPDAPITSAALRSAYIATFGPDLAFTPVDFTRGCAKYTYNSDEDLYSTPDPDCKTASSREIYEEIEKIYSEGDVIYVITSAGIYDHSASAIYRYDDLFRPLVTGVSKDDLPTYLPLLNRYQYTFKSPSSDENYYFTGIVKLR